MEMQNLKDDVQSLKDDMKDIKDLLVTIAKIIYKYLKMNLISCSNGSIC